VQTVLGKYDKRAPTLGHGCPDPAKAKDLAMDGLILRRPWMVESSAGRERKAPQRPQSYPDKRVAFLVIRN
jgi:hypothetical protein